MKKFFVILPLILLLLPVGHASLSNWDVKIDINEDKTTVWTVNLIYLSPVAKSDYFVLGNVQSYEVLADGLPVTCATAKDIGTSIICSNINAQNVVYTIRTAPMINNIFENYRMFTQKVSATEITDSFSVTVSLPLGAVLVEESRIGPLGFKPFEPSSGVQGSDGRKIFVKWDVTGPKLGQTLDISVIYEQVSDTLQLGIFAFIVGAIALVVIFILFTYFRRQNMKEILPVLSEGERKIMQIVLREKTIDQRAIVKETDMSKASVSRHIQHLVRRGIIEKTARGRKNLISLKKSIRAQNIEKAEGKKNKGQISINYV